MSPVTSTRSGFTSSRRWTARVSQVCRWFSAPKCRSLIWAIRTGSMTRRPAARRRPGAPPRAGEGDSSRKRSEYLPSVRDAPACREQSASRYGGRVRSRLVAPGWIAECDVDPVPSVDRHHRHRQIDKLALAEMPTHPFVNVVFDPVLADHRKRLRPLQRRALPFAVARGFAPCVEHVKPLLAFARVTKVLPVHVKAVGAAVYLRTSQGDKIQQPLTERPLGQIVAEPEHHFHRFLRVAEPVQPELHRETSWGR